MDRKKYADTARLAAAESAVLLRNEKRVLPLKDGEKIAVFGRIQFDYYRSGTGSGGMVNVPYETNILDSLKKTKKYRIDEKVEKVYREWVEKHPFDRTFIEKDFWMIEPWAQEEMPVTEEMTAEAAGRNDVALIIFGRTAGEERDSLPEKGSWYLSEKEEKLLQFVTDYFSKTIVILNTAGIMDMQWVEKYQPEAVLYVWQGGMEGGNAAVDLLSGNATPSGKLCDSIAWQLEDYPAWGNFGSDKANIYQEDIYVGYRYFETFAPEKVQYPFGYGLSYTAFEWKTASIQSFISTNGKMGICIDAEVKNTGDTFGKEVLQVYLEKPQGSLGNPVRELVGFAKTGNLEPGEVEDVKIPIKKEQLASYDDGGKTGHKSAWVIEKGEYRFYTGNSSRNLRYTGSYEQKETEMIRQLEEALAPVKPFQRLIPHLEKQKMQTVYEEVPIRTTNLAERMQMNREILCRKKSGQYRGNQGWKLEDVKNTKISMEKFLSQISNEALACLVRGEGMRSPKVTSGTAAAFGGVTDELKSYGIPIGCCADGPSGIRRDDGHQAFSIPIGTALACTFNLPLTEVLFEWMGKELAENQIELLLGPGMNIHRYPLNGRNFEYFSEDPLLSGMMAAAEIRGMEKAGVSGTLKHFAANNQETARVDCEAIVSERALREVYLRGFEIALWYSHPWAIMSTYGPINGIWTASNYDLLTTVLRKEWGFDGLVMTDWEARMNEEHMPPSVRNTSAMIRAQNDLYMIVDDSKKNPKKDNTMEALEDGRLSREELLRSAANICNVLMHISHEMR